MAANEEYTTDDVDYIWETWKLYGWFSIYLFAKEIIRFTKKQKTKNRKTFFFLHRARDMRENFIPVVTVSWILNTAPKIF